MACAFVWPLRGISIHSNKVMIRFILTQIRNTFKYIYILQRLISSKTLWIEFIKNVCRLLINIYWWALKWIASTKNLVYYWIKTTNKWQKTYSTVILLQYNYIFLCTILTSHQAGRAQYTATVLTYHNTDKKMFLLQKQFFLP